MSADLVYDVIVVGAGVEGSASAENLSKRDGIRVLLLEQFPLPHSRGSSHGQTRITRRAYTDAFYTQMMDFCSKYWTRLQETSGQDIFRQVGYLAIGAIGGEFLKENIHCMTVNNAPYTLLQPQDFRRKYPMLRFADDIGGLLDPDGGVLMADKILLAMRKSFLSHGGTLRDGERLEQIVPGETIEVQTNKGRHRGKSLILCCGPWTNQVLAPLNLRLPLKPQRISVCYWRERESGSHSPQKLPTFLDDRCCDGHCIYGIPSLEYPGHVKLCLHYGPEIDAELRDVPNTDYVLRLLKDYVRDKFPGLEYEPSIVESCVYTLTPDCHFLLDRHPAWSNIVIGAGFSGHGFKLSPAVGKILADLALDVKTHDFDLTPFKLSRFGSANKANL
ncbi:peroxisomal sarcosine oxidase [Plakobranchus ocellatus]|uniref:Peroxisomal sarcosine oxidase n=1 Tax=Plakobranchus ocellatus TaxID=259542 RepID=A0AAV4CIT3_9GAST|nr:peroxisomal sarcosine oxidase [Plakobranchus ocellatus]